MEQLDKLNNSLNTPLGYIGLILLIILTANFIKNAFKDLELTIYKAEKVIKHIFELALTLGIGVLILLAIYWFFKNINFIFLNLVMVLTSKKVILFLISLILIMFIFKLLFSRNKKN